MLLLLHSAFMLSVVKLLLKGEGGGCALNSHGNNIVDHGIVVLNLCRNPVLVHMSHRLSVSFCDHRMSVIHLSFSVSKIKSP